METSSAKFLFKVAELSPILQKPHLHLLQLLRTSDSAFPFPPTTGHSVSQEFSIADRSFGQGLFYTPWKGKNDENNDPIHTRARTRAHTHNQNKY